MSDFIRRQAEAYVSAPINRAPWEAYADSVVRQWDEITRLWPIQIIPSHDALTYLDTAELTRDLNAGRIKVWSGGDFSFHHPLAPVAMLSRAVHDYKAHYLGGYSFSPIDELKAALAVRLDFPAEAEAAQWTDDVAMGCYYAHYGRWPRRQLSVIVPPDWEGLQEYLKEVSGC